MIEGADFRNERTYSPDFICFNLEKRSNLIDRIRRITGRSSHSPGAQHHYREVSVWGDQHTRLGVDNIRAIAPDVAQLEDVSTIPSIISR